MRRLKGMMVGLLLAAVAGCADQLVVENTNDPDRLRVEGRPSEIEVLVASHYRVIHNTTLGTNESLLPQLMVMGMESYSSNANFGMNVRGSYPRSGINNNRGNATATSVYSPFTELHQAARAGALALSKLNDPNFIFSTGNAQKQRARAFAFFLIGVGLGNVALAYDSGTAIHSSDLTGAADPALPFVAYDSLMRYALANLDSAIAIATGPVPTGTSWFPLPSTWISGQALTAAQFAQLCNTYQARFRAGVARTPTERLNVDWNAVIADANAGITADFAISMSNVTGGWFYRPAQMDLYQSWHQMWSFIVGMADTSGGYNAWLAVPHVDRLPFLILTNDLRFPSGTTRAAQNTASGCGASSCLPPNANQFYRNRPGGVEVAVQGIAYSYYDFHRFQSYYNANRGSATPFPLPFFPVAEMNLLRAEGQLRLGFTDPAITLINVSRVLRGLPAIPLGSTTVPGTGCVPRVPTGPNGPTACGSIMEAMKWEKRMETAYLSWGGWFFDGRGWGDLPQNTPLHYPVPYQELDARTQPIYTITTGAAAGTYGL